jgi:hypothetical protein
MRGRLIVAGAAASFGLVFVPGLVGAAGASPTCGYPAVTCTQPQLTSNDGGAPGTSTGTSQTSGDGDAAVGTSSAPTTSTGSLPFTGADVAELSAIGVAALGTGALLVRRGRPRHA